MPKIKNNVLNFLKNTKFKVTPVYLGVAAFLFVFTALVTASLLDNTSQKPEVQADTRTVIVDHNSISLFEQIPPEYLQAAKNMKVLFIDRSVGGNVSDGLNCMSKSSLSAAPNSCKRFDHPFDNPTTNPWSDTTVNFQPSTNYNRDNWDYLYWGEWTTSGGCGNWQEKINCFSQTATGLPASISRNGVTMSLFPFAEYNAISYQNSYLEVSDGSTIDNDYFTNNPSKNDVYDVEAFAAANNKTLIHWTSSLARSIGNYDSQEFNRKMREYVQQNGGYLIDFADIISHDPAGNPCYDNRDGVQYCTGNGNCENWPNENPAQNYPAICPHYTTETEGGHLGSTSGGSIRAAKAFWVMMAQIAGWAPGGSGTYSYQNQYGTQYGTEYPSQYSTQYGSQYTTEYSYQTPSSSTGVLEIHVGNITQSSATQGSYWIGTASVYVHDSSHNAVSGAVVTASFTGAYTGTRSCTTGPGGWCPISSKASSTTNSTLQFTVNSVTKTGYGYVSSSNHDADGSSNGTTATINRQ